MSSLAVIIMTLNEEKHIERCLHSVFQITHQVFVVDSFSSDMTVKIAQSLGVQVQQHEFINHAEQLRWALDNMPFETEWVMRVDADEVISPALAKEVSDSLKIKENSINGFMIPLFVCFQGSMIRHGGYPQWQVRIWRRGKAEIERRWMDEKIIVMGRIGRFHGEYIDDNLKSIAWWTDKHNGYSTREAIDLLNGKYGFCSSLKESNPLTRQARQTRWMKEHVYAYLSPGIRAFLYFGYRMIFRLGILDGSDGFAFHFLQGCWYRYLADMKVRAVEHRMKADSIDCVEAIRCELGVNPLM